MATLIVMARLDRAIALNIALMQMARSSRAMTGLRLGHDGFEVEP
jgi:hypothetical protein